MMYVTIIGLVVLAVSQILTELGRSRNGVKIRAKWLARDPQFIQDVEDAIRRAHSRQRG